MLYACSSYVLESNLISDSIQTPHRPKLIKNKELNVTGFELEKNVSLNETNQEENIQRKSMKLITYSEHS